MVRAFLGCVGALTFVHAMDVEAYALAAWIVVAVALAEAFVTAARGAVRKLRGLDAPRRSTP